MGPSRYTRIADEAKRKYHALACEYCGEETLAGAQASVCCNCESAIGMSRKKLQSTNPHLFDSLESIRAAVAGNDYDSASKIYDALIADKKMPQLDYAKGIMLVDQSNCETAKIRYDRRGFMDENIQYRERSLRLISDAKRHIARGLYMLKSSAKEGADDPKLWHSMVLCELKLGNLRGARDNAYKINPSKNKMLADYSKILVNQAGGDYETVLDLSDSMLDDPACPTNVLYYVGFSHLRLGNPDSAREIIESLDGLMSSRKIARVLWEIRNYRAI